MRLFLSILLITLVHPLTYAGNDAGNGGDAVVEEFIAICEPMVNEVLPKSRFSNLNYKGVCAETDIVSVEYDLVLNGVLKDAINYPSKNRIEIQRNRWLSLPWTLKNRLTLHEILGFIGVDDSDYRYTKEILGSLNISIKPLDYAQPSDAEINSWKQSVVEKLKEARIAAIYQKTLEDEALVLESSITAVLAESKEDWMQNSLMLLHGALVDADTFSNKTELRATLLRKIVVLAIDSLEANTDIADYKIVMLNVLKLSVQAHEAEEELQLILRGSHLSLKALERLGANASNEKLSLLVQIHEVYENSKLHTDVKLIRIRKLVKNLIKGE